MPKRDQYLFDFGDFRLDPRSKILSWAGEPIPLKPKVVETLIALVENAGEVVVKDDLMSAVWPDTFVAENNLSVNIYALRKGRFYPDDPASGFPVYACGHQGLEE